ncbi:MAG: trypsin-like peptidase domain-containing protein [Pirellulales bacterium]
MASQRSVTVTLLGALLIVVVVLLGADILAMRPAQGQITDQALTTSERDALLAQLKRDAAELDVASRVVKTVVRLVGPSVVHIEVEKSEGIRRSQQVEEAGSGVITRVGDSYYVLTNRHVVLGAELEHIQIFLNDGRRLTATQQWDDQGTDVAVLAVDDTDLVACRLGDSDLIEIGDFVLAVGSPFGLSHSVTYGIISAKGRWGLELGGDSQVGYQDFIQTDAAINPGNSGGPLINLHGEVVGLNTAIASNSGGNEGIGFSIPINLVKNIARQLIDTGHASRAYLGVVWAEPFSAQRARQLGLNRPQGALITRVTDNSPAADSGLQANDVVLRFNGVRIEDGLHLKNLVGLLEVGHEVPLLIFRNRETKTLMIRLDDRSKYPSQSSATPQVDGPDRSRIELVIDRQEQWEIDSLGLTVVHLNNELANTVDLGDVASGLMITAVRDGGPAVGGLVVGDVIVRLQDEPIQDIDDVERVLLHNQRSNRIAVGVLTQGGSTKHVYRTVPLRPDWQSVSNLPH